VALRIGPHYRHECTALSLSGANLTYVNQTKYLGIMLCSARVFKCSFDHVKLKFYRCFNAVLTRARNAGNELVLVHLLKSVCLPVILYAVEALQPVRSALGLHTLDNLINRAIYRIFGCSQSADVNYIRLMFDLPDMEVCVQRRFCSFSRQFHSCLSWAEVITYVHAM